MANWPRCCGCRRDRSVRWPRNVKRCIGPSGWITSAAACTRWTCSCCTRPSGAIMPLCAASPTSLSSSRHPTGSRIIAPRRSYSAAGPWRHRAMWLPACTHCGRASTGTADRDEGGLSDLLQPAGESLALAGQPDKAIELLAEQRREFEQLSLAVWMPELLRVQAAIMLQADPGSTAAAGSILAKRTVSRTTADTHARASDRDDGSPARSAAGRRGTGGTSPAKALAQVHEDDGSLDLLEARALQRRLLARQKCHHLDGRPRHA